MPEVTWAKMHFQKLPGIRVLTITWIFQRVQELEEDTKRQARKIQEKDMDIEMLRETKRVAEQEADELRERKAHGDMEMQTVRDEYRYELHV